MRAADGTQDTAHFIIREIFRRRFGHLVGERISDLFLAGGCEAVLQDIDRSAEAYNSLAARILADNGLSPQSLEHPQTVVSARTLLSVRERRCRDRLEHLRVTTPLLLGGRDDLLTLTNGAYMFVEELEAYVIAALLLRSSG